MSFDMGSVLTAANFVVCGTIANIALCRLEKMRKSDTLHSVRATYCAIFVGGVVGTFVFAGAGAYTLFAGKPLFGQPLRVAWEQWVGLWLLLTNLGHLGMLLHGRSLWAKGTPGFALKPNHKPAKPKEHEAPFAGA